MDYKTVSAFAIFCYYYDYSYVTLTFNYMYFILFCHSLKKQDLTFPIKLYNTIFNVVIQQQRGILYFEARGKT